MINIRCATFLVGVYAGNLINLQFHHKRWKKKPKKKNQKMKHNQIKSDPKNQKKEETASLLLFPFHFSNVKSGQAFGVQVLSFAAQRGDGHLGYLLVACY